MRDEDPEAKLARQIVAQAVLDYLALSFPERCPRYLRRWYKAAYGRGGNNYDAWLAQRRREAAEFLRGQGGKLADLVEMDCTVAKAFTAVIAGQNALADSLEQSARNGAVL